MPTFITPVIPSWGKRAGELTVQFDAAREARDARADADTEDVGSLLRIDDAHVVLTERLVLSALDWSRPHVNGWWQQGLDVAARHPSIGRRMLAHALEMFRAAWHDEDSAYVEPAMNVAWACLRDPDGDLNSADIHEVLDFIETPAALADHVSAPEERTQTWLKVTAKLIAACALSRLAEFRNISHPTAHPDELVGAFRLVADDVVIASDFAREYAPQPHRLASE